MEILFYFLKAVLIGIIIAAPIGPISMICIRKSLEMGFAGTFAVSFGAAVADAIFATVAAFGLSAISDFMVDQSNAIKVVGGCLLLYLAYKELKSLGKVQAAPTIKRSGILKLIIKVFALTVVNPMTIIAFMAVFATLKKGPATMTESIALVSGITAGSFLLYACMGGAIVAVKHKLSQKFITTISLISVLILALFGVYALVAGLIKLI